LLPGGQCSIEPPLRQQSLGGGQRGGSPRQRGEKLGIIGYCDLVSMTLITMQAEAPNDSVPPLQALSK
jgi:hypothetical protein